MSKSIIGIMGKHNRTNKGMPKIGSNYYEL